VGCRDDLKSDREPSPLRQMFVLAMGRGQGEGQTAFQMPANHLSVCTVESGIFGTSAFAILSVDAGWFWLNDVLKAWSDRVSRSR